MMRCGQKVTDARREVRRIVGYSQAEQRGRRHFLAATRRDGVIWMKSVVTRSLFGMTKSRRS
ncbi:MAG: hypothetical protein ACREV0_04720, partial [Burkholderiales bacterium]